MNKLSGVIFFGAHPDDETVMAGGTLAMLHERGIPTHVVCATDGRGGESGGVTGIHSTDDLARVRLEELRGAALALGVNNLTMLNYVDPVVGPGEELYGFAADEETLIQQIAGLIRELGANVVLSHGSSGEYGHPAHLQMHRAVSRAVREQTPDVLFYTVAALVPGQEDRLWNKNDPAHLVLDIHPWFEAKLNAMICHATQHDLFKRRRKLTNVRDAVRTIESFRRQWPQTPPDKNDPFFTALLAAGASIPSPT